MQGMVDQLEQMVREETNAGWDWMAGVKAQMGYLISVMDGWMDGVAGLGE
jgi:hypothetical protein